MIKIYLFIFILLYSPLWAETGSSFKKYFDLPPLKALERNKTHLLRVGFVVDKGKPQLKKEERTLLLEKIKKGCLDRLGYQVEIKEVWVREIDDFYKNYQYLTEIPAMLTLLDYDIQEGENRESDVEKVCQNLVRRHGSKKVLAYLKKPFIPKKVTNRSATLALKKQFFYYYGKLKKQLVDVDAVTSSYWVMDSILQNISDADFIFINHLTFGPDSYMPLYVTARGGVTTGCIEDNANNPLKAAGYISLYPFLTKESFLAKEVGPIPEKQRLDVLATYTLHEFGHLLDRRQEIYDHKHCISKAAISLNYMDWYREISSGRCRQKHPKLKNF